MATAILRSRIGLVSKLYCSLVYKSVLLIAFGTWFFICSHLYHLLSKFQSWAFVLGFHHCFYSPSSWFTILHSTVILCCGLSVACAAFSPLLVLSTAWYWGDTNKSLGCHRCWSCQKLLAVRLEGHLDLFWLESVECPVVLFSVRPVQCVEVEVSFFLAQHLCSLLFFLQPHSLFLSTQSGTQCGTGGCLGLLSIVRSGGHLVLSWVELVVGCQLGTIFPVGPVQCVKPEMSLLLA